MSDDRSDYNKNAQDDDFRNVAQDSDLDHEEDGLLDNIGQRLQEAELDFKDWLKDLTLPQILPRPNNDDNAKILSNKFDRKLKYFSFERQNSKSDENGNSDVIGSNYVVIQDGDFYDADDYVDLNGPISLEDDN